MCKQRQSGVAKGMGPRVNPGADISTKSGLGTSCHKGATSYGGCEAYVRKGAGRCWVLRHRMAAIVTTGCVGAYIASLLCFPAHCFVLPLIGWFIITFPTFTREVA